MATTIIKQEHFNDPPYKIPDMTEIRSGFMKYVELEEPKILKSLLGYELYTEFITAVAASLPPTDPIVSLISKWSDLRDGAEYEYNDYTYKYEGLVKLLTPRIYYGWIFDERQTKLTHSGGQIMKTGNENSESSSLITRGVRAWNDYVDNVGSGCYAEENTLYGFLMADNLGDQVYGTDWMKFFRPPKYINEFGI